jgi:hypothetical protein
LWWPHVFSPLSGLGTQSSEIDFGQNQTKEDVFISLSPSTYIHTLCTLSLSFSFGAFFLRLVQCCQIFLVTTDQNRKKIK